MNNVFNKAQILKSSENCDKYSKSVSYETLVGGTTTIGREYEQNQRLCECGADKPLSAVGTLTSLLCNSAKVMEKLLYHHSEPKAKNPKKTGTVIIGRGCEPIISSESKRDPRLIAMQSPRMTEKVLSFLRLRGASGAQGISAPASCRKAHKRRFLFNSWILHFTFAPFRMTIPVLALILTLITTAESRADCRALQKGWASSCKTLEPSGTCGTGCSYTYNPDMKTVYITATGNDAKIGGGAFQGSFYENNSMPAKTFVINGAIKIGNNAFSGSSEVISGANGALILTGVEHHGFGDYATLSGTIIIPEGTEFGSIAFHGVTLAEDAKIYCGVKNCKQKMIDSCNDYDGSYDPGYITRCLAVVNSMGGKLLAYPDGCTKMGASGCTKCKNENFKLNDGECDRLRWTPAEAAKVLTDDNNNSVTITFKK